MIRFLNTKCSKLAGNNVSGPTKCSERVTRAVGSGNGPLFFKIREIRLPIRQPAKPGSVGFWRSFKTFDDKSGGPVSS